MDRSTDAAWPSVEMDTAATSGIATARLSENDSVDALMAKVAAADESPVSALLVYNANPCHALKNAAVVTEAVRKIPFVLSFATYMDETAQEADVVLPCHMFLECTEELSPANILPMDITALTRPMVTPRFDTRHPGDAMLSLAAAMQGSVAASFPWEGFEACFEAVKPGMWKALSKTGMVMKEKVTLVDKVDKMDFSLLSREELAITAPGDTAGYPLVLIPMNTMRLTARMAASPFAVKTVSDTVIKGTDGFVDINPETAQALHLSQGDDAVIETPVGRAVVKVNLFEGIMPGVVAMAEGLGHRMDGNRYIGGKGVNVNALVGPVMDAESGLDAAWGIRAKLSRA